MNEKRTVVSAAAAIAALRHLGYLNAPGSQPEYGRGSR